MATLGTLGATMSKAAFTIKVFAVYLFGLGIFLVVLPNLLFKVFDPAVTRTVEHIVQVIGG